jgi:hypothetical protein
VGQSKHLNKSAGSGNPYETTSNFRVSSRCCWCFGWERSRFRRNKDMVQLQTQVQQLQEQMTAMQRSFDERMGVMKNLVETNTDAVNKVAWRSMVCRPRCQAAGRLGVENRPAFRADSITQRHAG